MDIKYGYVLKWALSHKVSKVMAKDYGLKLKQMYCFDEQATAKLRAYVDEHRHRLSHYGYQPLQ